MGAVAAALILLTMLSGPTIDPDAPPPAANAGAEGEPAGGFAVGQPAPLHFTLKDRHGVDVNLESFKGKVILINFWATWCGPCRVEIPDLMELQDQYRGDLVVLGIDVLDEFTRVQAFADELQVNYPLLDGNNRDDVEKAFGPMWGLPTTVVVARDGTILKKHAGIASKEQFQQYIESAL
jgi:thiol-disulfide isomerase/thioredoxin